MLANSPNTPEDKFTLTSQDGLGAVREEDENFEHRLISGEAIFETPKSQEQRMSLAAELGVESPPDIVEVIEVPLKEKKADRNVIVDGRGGKASSKAAIGKGSIATEAGKKVSSRPTGGGDGFKNWTKPRSVSSTVSTEKENGVSVRASRRSSAAATASSTMRSVSGVRPAKFAAKPTVMGGITKAKAAPGPGPRRVPIDSAEAPQIARRKS